MSHDRLPTDNPAVVSVGLPYANGDLHVGHLRGYVTGDLYSRALRRVGQQTAFVCGSDMHGTPIAVNAAEEGVDPAEFALDWHETYEQTFPQFNVEFDSYGHTDDETNTALTQEFVRSWVDEGHVIEKEIQVAWDAEDDQPLPDRYVEGTCPYCGELARGDECDEGCQRHLEPGEIENPTSVLTGNPAEYREREHKFLRLSDFQEYLQGFIDRLDGTDNARNQPREWIEGELQDLCITRDMEWGIDYPDGDVSEKQGDGGGEAADREDLVLYVWVDAPIEYVAATKQYTERVGSDTFDWKEAWKLGGETRPGTAWDDDWTEDAGEIVHVIGRDIIQHHTVFWPSMLRGAGYTEPRAVLATGFVGIDGKALSTSRNRAVWADEYLGAGFHPDLFRYYVTTGSGLEKDVDFSWDRFQQRVNDELVGNLGNFAYRSLLFAHRNYGGTPESPAGTDITDEVDERIADAIEDFEDAVAAYDVRQLGSVAVELANFGNEYIQRNEPWNLTDEDPNRAAQVIRDTVQVTKAVAVLMQSVMPEKAQRLWEHLGETGAVADAGLGAAREAPPAEFDEPSELFEKIEDDQIEALNETLRERAAAASDDEAASPEEADGETVGESPEDADSVDEESEEVTETDVATADLEPLADGRISFGDFEELDIRVGEITAAEAIEDSDKLLLLDVDIGFETRQVVAGIKQLHDPAELPGTPCVLLANMEKAELFGYESNGMILAAGEQADLLTTHGDADLGTKIQ